MSSWWWELVLVGGVVVIVVVARRYFQINNLSGLTAVINKNVTLLNKVESKVSGSALVTSPSKSEDEDATQSIKEMKPKLEKKKPTATPTPSPVPTSASTTNIKDKSQKTAKKKKKLTAEEKELKRQAKEELRKQREDEQLEKLRKETEKFKEEQEKIKQQQQRLVLVQTLAKKKKSEYEKELERKENEKRRQMYLEEERRLQEEEEEMKKKAAPPVVKVVEEKNAWGVVNGVSAWNNAGGVGWGGISFRDIQRETVKKKEPTVNQGLQNYRTERYQRRKQILQTLHLTKVQVHHWEDKIVALKMEVEKKYNSLDKKLQDVICMERKKLLWRDGTQLKIDANNVGRVYGIISDLHPLIVGEKGTNINLLRIFNVHINVSFSSTDPIALRGELSAINIVYEKIKQLLQWKYYRDEAKNQASLKAKYMEDAKVQKNMDKLKELSVIHENLHSWCVDQSNQFCIKFHNEHFGRSRLDLRGLKEPEAFSLFVKTITEIEEKKLYQLSQQSFEEMEVIVPFTGGIASTLNKEILDYLKEYQFRFNYHLDKGLVLIEI